MGFFIPSQSKRDKRTTEDSGETEPETAFLELDEFSFKGFLSLCVKVLMGLCLFGLAALTVFYLGVWPIGLFFGGLLIYSIFKA